MAYRYLTDNEVLPSDIIALVCSYTGYRKEWCAKTKQHLIREYNNIQECVCDDEYNNSWDRTTITGVHTHSMKTLSELKHNSDWCLDTLVWLSPMGDDIYFGVITCIKQVSYEKYFIKIKIYKFVTRLSMICYNCKL
jgi:hypothetical protein